MRRRCKLAGTVQHSARGHYFPGRHWPAVSVDVPRPHPRSPWTLSVHDTTATASVACERKESEELKEVIKQKTYEHLEKKKLLKLKLNASEQ